MQVQVQFIMDYMEVHMLGQSLVVKNYVNYTVVYMMYQLLYVDFITFMDHIKLKGEHGLQLLVSLKKSTKKENH